MKERAFDTAVIAPQQEQQEQREQEIEAIKKKTLEVLHKIRALEILPDKRMVVDLDILQTGLFTDEIRKRYLLKIPDPALLRKSGNIATSLLATTFRSVDSL